MLAALDSVTLSFLASLLVGGAVYMAFYWLVTVMSTGDLAQGKEWRYDVSRVNELRRQSVIYRSFQPAIRVLARFNRGAFPGTMKEMAREIQAAGLPRAWLPEEYLARCELIAIFLTPLYVYLFVELLDWPGIVLAITSVLLTAWFLRIRLRSRARARLQEIKRRMPYVLDLVTLLMEAGSTFLRALEDAVHEYSGQPIAVEFGRVLTDMHLGKTRTEAFHAMRDRLEDNEITSIIGAIIQGESLGTALAHVFRTQADVLRIKRSQRAETVAGEAGVNMLFPGVLVMVSSVLVILGPWILNYLYFGMNM
jgi:tight adherence protein C